MATIDFTSAYRDATQGSTLKALAARRAEMQAANAALKPREVKSPWQGAANIADTISGAIREGRIANQEAAGRARFAELLAGGLTPDEIGEAMGLDPETTMKYQERTWAQEDTKATREYDAGRDDLKHGWDVQAAADRVKAEQEAARLADEAATKRQDDQQAASLVLADHNATIDQKQAAQKVIDDAKVEELKVRTDRQTSDIDRRADAEIATKKAQQDAAMADPVAKVKLAMQTPGPDGKPLMSAEEGNAEIAAIQLKKRLDSQSPASKEFDLQSSKDNQDWVGTGRAQAVSNQIQLDKVLADLDKFAQGSGTLSGGISAVTGIGAPSGVVTGILPDPINRWLSQGTQTPDPVNMRENVRAVAQQSLKAVLGTQFAAIEGEGVMSRAYDPGATPAENANRVKLLKAKLEQVAKYNDMRAEWLANNPTMEGFTGPTPAEVQADFLAYTNSPEFTGGGGGDATAAPSGGGGGAPAPKAGDVVDGYTYVGGDPSKPESWKKQ